MFSDFWNWWQGTGTPAAAIQQLAFIIFTGTATVVGLISLNSWRRQQRSNVVATAIKAISDAATLVTEHILIERLSPAPMAYFPDLKGFDAKWQAKALNRIRDEQLYWKGHTAELDDRLAAFRSSISTNSYLLGNPAKLRELSQNLADVVAKYNAAIAKRQEVIRSCAQLNTENGYRPMVSLTSLARQFPLLWRKERNLESVEFESEIRKTIDSLRAYLSQRR